MYQQNTIVIVNRCNLIIEINVANMVPSKNCARSPCFSFTLAPRYTLGLNTVPLLGLLENDGVVVSVLLKHL